MRCYRILFILIANLLVLHYSGFSQRGDERKYRSFQGSTLIFYNDSTYNYYYSPGCDICPELPVNAYNTGIYVKHKKRAYYLYTNPNLNPCKPVYLSGKEAQTSDSLFHLTIVDSIKISSEDVWTGFDDIHDHRNYYYLVKILYSHDSLDSVKQIQRMELYGQYYHDSKFDVEVYKQDSILAMKFKKEDEQRGLTVVNGTYFQQFICYDQQLDFVPVKGLPIRSIEIEIHPFYQDHSLSNYTDGFAKCSYPVQNENSSHFTLAIPEEAYQKIHNPFYYQCIAEIVNQRTIIFDRQVFFKLPKNKKNYNRLRKNGKPPKLRNSYGSFYGYRRLLIFEKRHKIYDPYRHNND